KTMIGDPLSRSRGIREFWDEYVPLIAEAAISGTSTSHFSRNPRVLGRARPTFRRKRHLWDEYDPLLAEAASSGTYTSHFSRKARLFHTPKSEGGGNGGAIK